MLSRQVLGAILAVGLAAAGLATVAAAQDTTKFLTNDDIVAMVKAGQSTDAILNAIQTRGTDFDVSLDAVVQLKKSGVPKEVIDAMAASVKQQRDASAEMLSARQAKAANEEAAEKAEADKEEAVRAARASLLSELKTGVTGEPAVAILQGTEKQALAVAHTQIVPVNVAPAQAPTLEALATDNAVTSALTGVAQMLAKAGSAMPGSGNGSMTITANPLVAPAMMAMSLLSKYKAASTQMTAVWAIAGRRSETVLHDRRPIVEVRFDGFIGVNVGEYEPILIRLPQSSSTFRLVGATVAKVSDMQSTSADWSMYAAFMERRIPTQETKVDAGRYLLEPNDALRAGQYGVVLRPVSKEKKFTGSNVGQSVGDGLIFNCVWSFEVP